MKKNKKNKAFSLVELALVIVIIGIMVSGIVYAKNLIYNTRLTGAKVVTEKSPLHNY
jgi:prepilin-type N-terminal cleavage/methylation domain-containing protein